jgi:hypothetical protein
MNIGWPNAINRAINTTIYAVEKPCANGRFMALGLQHEQIGKITDQSWLMVVALRVGGWQMQLLWVVAIQLYTHHRVLKSWLRGSFFSWTRCRKKNNDTTTVGYGFTTVGSYPMSWWCPLVDELMIPLWPLIQTDNPRESAARHRGGVRVGSSMGLEFHGKSHP